MAYYITDIDGNLIKVAGNYSFTESEAFLMAHPIGSYYISQNPTSPAELYGGAWEELDAGKTLWTIPTTETGAGGTIEAGLPNIKASYSAFMRDDGVNESVSGAFSTSRPRERSWNGASGDGSRTLSFNANKYNSIYRDDVKTVQPPAIKVYMWKRYA